jgi:hypothetical protein
MYLVLKAPSTVRTTGAPALDLRDCQCMTVLVTELKLEATLLLLLGVPEIYQLHRFYESHWSHPPEYPICAHNPMEQSARKFARSIR